MKNKKLEIPIVILITVIIAVVITTVIMNRGQTNVDPNLNVVDNSEEYVSPDKTDNENNETESDKMYASINGENFEVQLENNSTVTALAGMLPLELTMSDLNSNEKYAYLNESLPTSSYNPGRVEAGDVMLYGDDCLVIFYESFDTEFGYSKIGHIDGLPELGDGDVIVELSAE